jgi:hypothetical protein
VNPFANRGQSLAGDYADNSDVDTSHPGCPYPQEERP